MALRLEGRQLPASRLTTHKEPTMDDTTQDTGRFESLGRLEDLPQSYRDELAAQNLAPLWPSLRAMLPPHVPARRTETTHWAYRSLRPLLLKAGELTPIEKA